MRTSYLTFGAPLIEEDEIREVEATLRSGWIGTGPRVARFQEEFRSYLGVPHAVATNSGSSALHLSLLMAGVGPGDEVITTAHTFCATVNAIIHTGAKPVLVDVDRDTQNIDPEKLKGAATKRTRAILPVHFAGRPCDMDAILDIAREHGAYVINDAAHAIEAEWKGVKIGRLGDASCFSFYVTKNITTIEGGMISTPHEKWAQTAKIYALHGLTADAWKRFSDDGFKHYEVTVPGFKYNMTDVEAAVGLCQLARIEHWAARRREIWQRYNEAFADLPLFVPAPEQEGTVHARHLYTVLIDIDTIGTSRDKVQSELHKRRIGTGVHYTALHHHRFYQRKLGVCEGQFPNTEFIAARTLSLPFSPKLSDEDVGDVIEAVREVVGRRRPQETEP
ncbi:MAG: DegT/DnrJ/EryC1/StrS family aminotransferase [Chitinivibrionia bacterium]|nr:DegT/DnrJ/EryC1/StrS family aminotransferase [Chitinivibrionia bacterium]